jgi:hypothetical protein
MREMESALRNVLRPISHWGDLPKTKGGNVKESQKEEVLCVLNALDISLDEPLAQRWLKLADGSSEGALHRRAHRSSLAPPRPTDDPFRELWDNFQTILDSVLTRLERRFSEYLSKPDAPRVRSCLDWFTPESGRSVN